MGVIDNAIANRLNEQPIQNVTLPQGDNAGTANSPFKCPKCDNPMRITTKKNDPNAYYIGCSAYPGCNNAVWLPAEVKKVEVTEETCPTVNISSQLALRDKECTERQNFLLQG